MSYLLSRDLSKFKPRKISTTKMKIDTMRDQLPNPIHFIIDYISSQSEDQVAKPSCTSLYQNYVEWCGGNGEKPFSNNILGKKFSQINIERKRASGRKREWQYILNRSKIVTKLCESNLSDMEEFSDIPQPDLPKNETTDIFIFNMPEMALEGSTILQKIIPLQPEKNTPLSNTKKDKKADKQDESTQALFDYVAEDTRVLVDSSSKTAKISKVINPAFSRSMVEKSAR